MQKSISPDVKIGVVCCFASRDSWFLETDLQSKKKRHRTKPVPCVNEQSIKR